MIKTIKVKKQLRLDELIKYIFDNGIEDKVFPSNGGSSFDMCEARISGSGNIKTSGYINEHTTFTVEVEEEINKRHKFRQLTTIFKKIDDDKVRAGLLHNSSIYDVLVGYGGSKVIKIYALVGTTLELIWEAE